MKALISTAIVILIAVGGLGYKVRELDAKLTSMTSGRSLGVLSPSNTPHKIKVADANGDLKDCVVSFTEDRRVIVAVDDTTPAYLQFTYSSPGESELYGKATVERIHLNPGRTVVETDLPTEPHGKIRFSLHDRRTDVELVTFGVNETVKFGTLEKS